MIKLVNIVNITHTHTWSTLTWCILQARCYTFTCVAGIADFVCHALYNAVTDPVRSKICRNCVSQIQYCRYLLRYFLIFGWLHQIRRAIHLRFFGTVSFDFRFRLRSKHANWLFNKLPYLVIPEYLWKKFPNFGAT